MCQIWQTLTKTAIWIFKKKEKKEMKKKGLISACPARCQLFHHFRQKGKKLNRIDVRVERIIIPKYFFKNSIPVFCPFNPKRDRLIRRLFSRFFWSFLYQQIFYTQRQDNASYKNRLVGKNKADTQKKRFRQKSKGIIIITTQSLKTISRRNSFFFCFV